MLGKLNNQEIENVFKEQLIGRIGCHANNITYIVPTSYAYDGETIYARAHEGLKIELMRKNPHVCFQVDIIENMGNWKSVIAWGEFRELTETLKRNSAIQKLLDRKIPGIASNTVKLTADWPFSSEDDLSAIPGIIFSILINEKTGRFEKSDEVNMLAVL